MKPREPEPAPTPSNDRTPGFWTRLACALALALATVATFGSAVLNSWAIIDDPAYVTANPHVLGGLTPESVRWAFTQPHGGNWHPLTSLSHMLDMRFTWTGADGLPDPAVPNGDRDSTVVAPQALFMLNGSVVLKHTRILADKLLALPTEFRQVFARKKCPTNRLLPPPAAR